MNGQEREGQRVKGLDAFLEDDLGVLVVDVMLLFDGHAPDKSNRHTHFA